MMLTLQLQLALLFLVGSLAPCLAEPAKVHLLGSFAPLFSGRSLSDCHTFNDTSCSGGIAAAVALRRFYASDAPSLTMHRLDKQSQFVQTHPLGWSVNRLVLHEYYGYEFFSSPPSLLLQHKDDKHSVSQRDISDLQSHDMPLILTNAAVPPSLSWAPYVERVHYDQDTNLAVMTLAGNGEPLSSPDQVEAVKTALRDIQKQNEIRGCVQTTSLYDQYLEQNPVRTPIVNMAWDDDSFTPHRNQCWIPVLYFSDFEPESFYGLVQSVADFVYPPAVLIDGGGNDVNATFPTPTQLPTPNSQRPNSTLWVTSMRYSSGGYFQHTMELTDDGMRIANFTNLLLDLRADLTPELKDNRYARDISFIRTLADQAEDNDPVVGQSKNAMPVAREGDYRRCKGGECEQGNLFADALRWRADSDVAFVTSGGLRGSGWPAGNVFMSHVWSKFCCIFFSSPVGRLSHILAHVLGLDFQNRYTSVSKHNVHWSHDGSFTLQARGLFHECRHFPIGRDSGWGATTTSVWYEDCVQYPARRTSSHQY